MLNVEEYCWGVKEMSAGSKSETGRLATHRAASSDRHHERRILLFLERFPEYRKTLRLAVAHEDDAGPLSYQGWQWHDVETHPTKLIRLITEGISKVNLKTRHTTYYVLREKDLVRRVLGTRDVETS